MKGKLLFVLYNMISQQLEFIRTSDHIKLEKEREASLINMRVSKIVDIFHMQLV